MVLLKENQNMFEGRGHRRTYVIKSSAPTSNTVKKKFTYILIKYFNTHTDTSSVKFYSNRIYNLIQIHLHLNLIQIESI